MKLKNFMVAKAPQEDKKSYIIQAEKAADAVLTGLEDGNYADIYRSLETIAQENVSDENYIFHAPGALPQITMLGICSIFSCVFAVGALIGIAVMMYSVTFFRLGVMGVSVSGAVILANAIIIGHCILVLRFYRRYSIYNRLMGFRNIELVDDLSSFVGLPAKRVIQDLSRAVKQKLIPQGHFGKDNIIFIITDKAYNEYLEKQAVYDRYYRKQREERMRMKDRSNNVKRAIDSGQLYLDRIRESNAIIKDKDITHKLDTMENIVSMIFNELDIHEDQIDKLGLFLNYYLPTTEKLLDAYIDSMNNTDKGIRLQKMQMEIVKTLDALNSTFEGILHSFYREQEMDILSDISALEIMMQQEG